MSVRATIGIVTRHAWPYERQAHSGLKSHFVIGESQAVDYLVVLDAIDEPIETGVPVERTLFICGEPPSIKTYDHRFLAQFGHVLTVDGRIKHPGRVLIQPAIQWFYGIDFRPSGVHSNLATFEQLRDDNPVKTRTVSIIASGKARTEGHRFRLAFVEELRSRTGVPVDIFGRNSIFVADKRSAIAAYRYHIVLENDVRDHYWTEKLADAFLGWSLPIYRGAPNAEKYFPESSFVRIPDSLSPAQAVSFALQSMQEADYSTRRPSIARARDRLLYEHNLFSVLDSLVQKQLSVTCPAGCATNTTRRILPEETFRTPRVRGRRRPLRPAIGPFGVRTILRPRRSR